MDPITELIKIEVNVVKWTKDHLEQILMAHPDEDNHKETFSDYGFKWPAFILIHLYLNLMLFYICLMNLR